MADGNERKQCEGLSKAVSLLREVVRIIDVDESEGETSQNNLLSSVSTSLENQPSTSRQYINNLSSPSTSLNNHPSISRYSVSNRMNSNDRFSSGSSNNSASPGQVSVSSSGGTKATKQDQFQRQTSVLENFRTLFRPYNQSNGPLAKRPRKSNDSQRSYKVKETWAHEFFCLADCTTSSVPSRAVKFQLQSAGLGRKKIIFGWKDNPFTFKAKLEEIFPRLVDGGGFDILRSGVNVQSLVLIPPPAAGYSVPFLRDMSGLVQALAYVRPAQTNLDIAEISVVSDNEVLCTYTFNSKINGYNYSILFILINPAVCISY